MKSRLAVLLLAAAVSTAACGDDDGPSSPTSPSSTTSTTATSAPTPPPAFNYADGLEILVGRLTNAVNKFSVRLTGNVNVMLQTALNDFAGAEMDMYQYLANGNRRKWTTQYANSTYNGWPSTIWKDVDTDNAVKAVFQVYPYRSNTPIPGSFPTNYRPYLRITDGLSLRHNSTDGLVYMQGALPPVSSTFAKNSATNGILRIEDPEVEPARLTEVAEMINGVLTVTCSNDRQAFPNLPTCS